MIAFILGNITGAFSVIVLLMVIYVIRAEKKNPEMLSDQELQDLAIQEEERRRRREKRRTL